VTTARARWRIGMMLALVTFAAAALAQPQPKPFAAGDVAAGKTLSDKDCNACHARKYDGDASRIYTRPDRKVRTPAQLLTQVQYCNTELGTSYFPEEEEHLAAYLNLQYYKFAP
jgi:cytochrome c553